MTRSFINVLTQQQQEQEQEQEQDTVNNTTDEMTWSSMIEKMRTYIKDRNFDQVPQLTGGRKIDVGNATDKYL
jgi:hypothetical protein